MAKEVTKPTITTTATTTLVEAEDSMQKPMWIKIANRALNFGLNKLQTSFETYIQF